MWTVMKHLFITVLSTALFVGSPMGLRAEETSHKSHHPAGVDTDKQKDAEQKNAQSKDMKMGGGMMAGDHMTNMMKMMQEMHGKMMGGGMAMMPKGDSGPSSLAFNGVAMKMHEAMAISYTGNADVDFVKGMIPHHQAAVDMAKTVLAFGKDPDIKKLAEDVIKAQEAEISTMTEWLKKQGQ